MPWRRKTSVEETQKLNRERDKRYKSKSEVRERKRERDRLYAQRKREQKRLEIHDDPLARLADTTTQRSYLEGESDMFADAIDADHEGAEEAIDVGAAVEEDGEVLENFDYNYEDGGFDYDGDIDMHDDGSQFVACD